jgi:tRNA A-37 threonylcarbamoyl transferase component Bud32
MLAVDRLPHGYSNFTRLVGGHVEKTYDGPLRRGNATRELACLTALTGHLPVATVIHHDLSVPQLTLNVVPGSHGQDLLDAGHASQVLRLVGCTLAALHEVPLGTVRGLDGEGSVIVHGDFGPQNMLFDLEADCVTGVLDWESAHFGNPIEDLAWTEWIVRMHHHDAIDALDELFAAAAQRPVWSERHRAMIRQVRSVLAYCESVRMDPAAGEWRDRLRCTNAWTE